MKEFDNLVSYLPSVVVEYLCADLDNEVVLPATQSFKTACLFADVSGFTKLSEELSQFKSQGVEELANQLNKFVSMMVRLTSRAGGDVLKFAGDAMMAFWPPQEGEDHTITLRRAVQCALDMQQQVDNFRFKMREKHEFRDTGGADDDCLYEGLLRVKLAIGFGPITIVHLGGNSDNVMKQRTEFVAMGPGLEQAFEAEKFTEPGKVVVSKDVNNMIKSYFTCTPVGGKCMQVNAAKEGVHKVKWRGLNARAQVETHLSSESEPRLWQYVPAAVMPYLQESNEFWAPEMRRVTTLFCNLGVQHTTQAIHNPHKRQAALDLLQKTFSGAQAAVFRYEGTINKFLIDDKGSVLIAVFGLPPFAHENDASRAVLSALSILGVLSDLKLNGGVGITTGKAFCGVVGHRGNRREYSVLGDCVNLAARLMQHATKSRCGVLIDSATVLTAGDDLRFAQMKDIIVKGKAAPVEVYQVLLEPPTMSNGQKDFHALQMARLSGLKQQESSNPALKLVHQRISKSRMLLAGPTTNVMKLAEADQVRNYGKLHPLAKERVRYMAERSKVNKGTGTTLERARMDKLVTGIERYEVSHRGRSSSRGKSSRSQLESGDEEHKQQSRPSARSMEEANLRRKKLKAAKVTFDKGGGANSITFMMPLPKRVVKIKHVKLDALELLRERKFLKDPSLGPEYYELRWSENAQSSRSVVDDDLSLSDLDKDASVLQVRVVQRETPLPMKAKSRRAASGAESYDQDEEDETDSDDDGNDVNDMTSSSNISRRRVPTLKDFESREALRASLLDKRNALTNGSRGGAVLIEGERGVGKTKLMADVLFVTGTKTQLVVAAGNPFETGTLARPFSVWVAIITQLLEESVARNQLSSLAPGGIVKMNSDGVERLIMQAIRDARGTAHVDKRDLFVLDSILETNFKDSIKADQSKDSQLPATIKTESAASRLSAFFIPRTSGGDRDVKSVLSRAKAAVPSRPALRSPKTSEDKLESKSKGLRLSWNTAGRGNKGGSQQRKNKSASPTREGSANPLARKGSSNKIVTTTSSFSGLGRTLSSERPTISTVKTSGSTGLGTVAVDELTTLKEDALAVVDDNAEFSQEQMRMAREAQERRIAIPVLASLVAGLALRSPTIVVIDDSHFMDTASWELAVELIENWKQAKVLLVLGHRKMLNHADEAGGIHMSIGSARPISVITPQNRHNMRAYVRNRDAHVNEWHQAERMRQRLASNPRSLRLEMKSDESRTGEIIAGILDVSTVAPILVDHLATRSHGNSMYLLDALGAYTREGLIWVQDDACFVDRDRLIQCDRLHLLPIPACVEAACATTVDALSTTQQLALKTAAMIGTLFTLELVRVAFPIPHLLSDLDLAWSGLVKIGLIEESARTKGGAVDGRAVEALYQFQTLWMADTLIQRMLLKQKRKLHEILSNALTQQAEKRRIEYMEKSNLAAKYAGWVSVRKDHARNMLKPWKRRWMVLHNDELIQYYDQSNPKRLEIIKLAGPVFPVLEEQFGGYHGYETKLGANLYEHCFCIKTSIWSKKGKFRTDVREFYIAVDTMEEVKDWVYKVNYQIQFYKLKSKAKNVAADAAAAAAAASSGNSIVTANKNSKGREVSPSVGGEGGKSPKRRPSRRQSKLGNQVNGSKSISNNHKTQDPIARREERINNAEVYMSSKARQGVVAANGTRKPSAAPVSNRPPRRGTGNTMDSREVASSVSSASTQTSRRGRKSSAMMKVLGGGGKSKGTREGGSTGVKKGFMKKRIGKSALGRKALGMQGSRRREMREIGSDANTMLVETKLGTGLGYDRSESEPVVTVRSRTVVDQMTFDEFEYINQEHALGRFWASEEEDGVAPNSQCQLSKSWFSDFGDLALVACNSAGQIEGYLFGYVTSRNVQTGVVHSCAVLPEARREGTATRLYMRFMQLCRERGCELVRCVVPNTCANSVAFHRTMGFEEYPAKSDLMENIGGDDDYVFFRRLDEIEWRTNPMVSDQQCDLVSNDMHR